MFLLIAGLVILVITGAVFWYCLPRNGNAHRFVGTEFEPYVGVAFTTAVALSFTLTLSGVLDMIGNQ
ncbi:hypothetical protein [Pseudorhodoplanes sinuspersici]|uniref:Uncharacterized protein n=1 Tax=Pseudorhodoplanes sinuspersici TaxID=1235591 RepID=A0A1W6ZRF9_9HYPH|nr:hypothetical protein [Pseudorhodoplanes sinuspersici]ARP99912.1 hypothetical protein CAK95_13080 [Pseudorhodoplanes sinuspersici]RKE70932.1 hypothetical protein DFP91_3184 [Pseudorhodoplanes sinuspersici]